METTLKKLCDQFQKETPLALLMDKSFLNLFETSDPIDVEIQKLSGIFQRETPWVQLNSIYKLQPAPFNKNTLVIQGLLRELLQTKPEYWFDMISVVDNTIAIDVVATMDPIEKPECLSIDLWLSFLLGLRQLNTKDDHQSFVKTQIRTFAGFLSIGKIRGVTYKMISDNVLNYFGIEINLLEWIEKTIPNAKSKLEFMNVDFQKADENIILNILLDKHATITINAQSLNL